jgi:hypothetical protein
MVCLLVGYLVFSGVGGKVFSTSWLSGCNRAGVVVLPTEGLNDNKLSSWLVAILVTGTFPSSKEVLATFSSSSSLPLSSSLSSSSSSLPLSSSLSSSSSSLPLSSSLSSSSSLPLSSSSSPFF